MYATRRKARCPICAVCARKNAAQPSCTVAAVLDRTATAMGGRELRRWLHRPLRDRRTVELRLQAIGTLIDKGLHGPLHDLLAHVGDVERGLARVALKTARPRDLAQLREALARLPDLQRLLAGLDSPALQ